MSTRVLERRRVSISLVEKMIDEVSPPFPPRYPSIADVRQGALYKVFQAPS